MAADNLLDRFQPTSSIEEFTGGNHLFCICSAAGRVVFTSGELKLMLGEDLTGRNLNDFMDDKTAAKVVAESYDGEMTRFDCTVKNILMRCSADAVDDQIAIGFMPVSGGRGMGINRNSAEFLSREISNSLAIMMMAKDNIKRECGGNEKIKSSLEVMSQNLQQMNRLTRNMLDCSLLDAGALPLYIAETDVVELCRRVCEDAKGFLHYRNIDVYFEASQEKIVFRFDPQKVERMILNLISNSASAMPKGGAIRVVINARENSCGISIIDNGEGISEDVLMHVFDKNYTMNACDGKSFGGAGFGLPIVRAFAQLHGGSFVIASNGMSGGGSIAAITLPYNMDMEVATLGSYMVDYAGGFSHVLLELCTVLPREFYM